MTWLGIAAVLLGVGIFGWMIFFDYDIGPEVYPVFLVPATLIVLAAIGLLLGRIRAGALGRT